MFRNKHEIILCRSERVSQTVRDSDNRLCGAFYTGLFCRKRRHHVYGVSESDDMKAKRDFVKRISLYDLLFVRAPGLWAKLKNREMFLTVVYRTIYVSGVPSQRNHMHGMSLRSGDVIHYQVGIYGR